MRLLAALFVSSLGVAACGESDRDAGGGPVNAGGGGDSGSNSGKGGTTTASAGAAASGFGSGGLVQTAGTSGAVGGVEADFGGMLCVSEQPLPEDCPDAI